MISKESFSVFTIRLLLGTAGIKIQGDKLRHLNYKAFVIFSNFLSVSLQLTMCFRGENMKALWIVVNNLIHCSNYCATWVIILRNKKIFLKLMDALKINIYQYPNHMMKYMPEPISYTTTSMAILIMVYVFLYFIMFAPGIHQIITNSPLSIDGLIFPCWYPWSVDTPIKYILTYVLQLVGGTFSCYYMPVTIFLVMHFVFVMEEHRYILHTVMQNIKAEDIANFDGAEIPRIQRNLLECMKHHRAIINFIRDFVSCYKIIFLLNLLYSTMVFTINCYITITGDNDLVKFMQTLFEFMIVFPYFFVYCYIGEIFQEMNSTLKDLIYDIKWYNKSIKFRKLILLLLSMTSQNISLKFSQKMVASYALFASVLRASYTYANLMLNMQR